MKEAPCVELPENFTEDFIAAFQRRTFLWRTFEQCVALAVYMLVTRLCWLVAHHFRPNSTLEKVIAIFSLVEIPVEYLDGQSNANQQSPSDKKGAEALSGVTISNPVNPNPSSLNR